MEQSHSTLENYRQGFRNLVRIVQIQALAIIVLVGVVYHYVNDVVPQDRYFAQTAEGGIMPLVSLDDPNQNMDALLSWSEQAVVDILTFGFNDIDQRFAYSQRYFSPEGWKTFATAMVASQLLSNVKTYQQIITSIPAKPAQILSWGYQNGKYTWEVYVPVIMTTRAGKNRSPKVVNVMLKIIKLPTSENPRGMGIDSWKSN